MLEFKVVRNLMKKRRKYGVLIIRKSKKLWVFRYFQVSLTPSLSL
jgi:hypothetical protein